MVESCKVAVVGGGIAGLITARELRKEGHHVIVFEKADRVGGLWIYSPKVDSDPLSLDRNREVAHSSVYKSLQTNLPRQVMAFSDYPNVPKEGGDPRNFPGHEEVLRYIEDFAHHFGLKELIRFKHEVVRVELVDEVSHKWVVESKARESTESNWELKEEVFDAVVICNGNHTEPRLADFPGRDTWPRLQMHSHNYRTPEQFENKVVVLIGFGPSAIDILKDISPIAKEVHHSIRGSDLKLMKQENNDHTWQHPMIESAGKDGKVVFQDGSIVDADIILHCTGYTSHFPFLKTNGMVTVDENRVGPLYKHVFPPSLAPWISFVGLNNRAVITRAYELQGKWVAKVLSGVVELPSQKAMMSSVEEDYSEMEKRGWSKHLAHSLQKDEYEYVSWLADQMNIIPPKWWKGITWFSMVTQIFQHGANYRDTWDVDKWLQDIDSSN